jgi:microtubule-associated protein-like 6
MLRASEQFQVDLTAVDWSSDGKFLVVGDRNGYVFSVDANSLAKLSQAKGDNADMKNAWIEDLKISPNSQMLAFGTHAGRSNINLCKISDGGK